MQIFVRERMKILSKSKVAQVFLFFFSSFFFSLWLNTLSLLALWFLSYFFPEKSHGLVESKTVKGMFATRHGNTCPRSLPIAHQTHRPVDGRKPGWRLGCLNSIRSATQTIADSSLLASVRATKTGPPFPDHFSAHKRTAVTTSTPQGCIFLFIYLLLCGVQKCCDNNFFCCFYRLNFFIGRQNVAPAISPYLLHFPVS